MCFHNSLHNHLLKKTNQIIQAYSILNNEHQHLLTITTVRSTNQYSQTNVYKLYFIISIINLLKQHCSK